MSTLKDRELTGYLLPEVVCRILRPKPKAPLSQRTLSLWRKRGIGPPYVKIGQSIFYPEAGLYRWLEQQTIQPLRERRRGR